MFEKFWKYMKKVAQWATNKPRDAIESGIISALTAVGASVVLYRVVPVPSLATISGILGGTLVGSRLVDRGLKDYMIEQEQTVSALSAAQIATLEADIEVKNARLEALTAVSDEKSKAIEVLQGKREQNLILNLHNSPTVATENPVVSQGMFSRPEVKTRRRTPVAVASGNSVNANSL